MTRWYPFLLLCPWLAGCGCRPNVVEPIELGLRVQPAVIEFGRVREGDVGRATLSLSAETRAQVSVSLSTDAPFGVEQFVDVPGSGETSVEVTFLAGDTEVDGVLRLVVNNKTAEVKLHGVGVRPLECRPSAECVVSVYSLEEDKCIESVAADDTPCDPASVCLEQGRCRAGQCLGIARRCDDRNACTDDACAMDLGCVHTPHVCPTPTAACRVATCDTNNGCGDSVAPDLTVCGPQNCTSVNICLGGTCQETPTPEGFPCAPSIACLPEAQCHNQECTRVLQADWSVDWSARLAHEPVGELTSSGAAVFFSTCADAGSPPIDAGLPDAGERDGGIDAGRALVCGLASYTNSGFERFVYPYEDDAPRSAWGTNNAGVVLLSDAGLEVRSKTNGSLRFALDVRPRRQQLVIERDRIFFWADGGVHLWLDGGAQLIQTVEEPTALARGEALFAWNPDAGVLTRVTFEPDGGSQRQAFALSGIESPHLAVAQNRVLFGALGSLNAGDDGDGGLVLFDWTDAGVTQHLEESTLSSATTTNAFFLRCDGGCSGGTQETWVRVFDAQTGQPRWETLVVGPSFPGTVQALTLLDGQPGAFAALVRSETPNGPRALLALYADGERKAICRLPPNSGAVELAHFSASALMVTVRKPDGTVALESYPLGALPVSHSTWSTPQGTFGTRSDRQ